jgi:hypothetical protein
MIMPESEIETLAEINREYRLSVPVIICIKLKYRIKDSKITLKESFGLIKTNRMKSAMTATARDKIKKIRSPFDNLFRLLVTRVNCCCIFRKLKELEVEAE